MLIKNRTLSFIAIYEIQKNKTAALAKTVDEVMMWASEIIAEGQYFDYSENEIESAIPVVERLGMLMLLAIRKMQG